MRNCLFLLIAFLSISVYASAQPGVKGDWEGKLNAGAVSLRIVFHIEDAGTGTLSGKMDSPDQGVKGIKCAKVSIAGDSVFIEVTKMAGFAGKIVDATHLNGTWSQGPNALPLALEKGAKHTELNRPQTPKPPFDYISEDVVYQNAAKTQDFGATITIPKGAGPFPAVLLITGSGLENRDEELFGHKPFAVIADFLTKRGYIVLRVDDRSKGQSTGDVKNATTADFAKDVNISFDYLKSRKEVDTKKMGLLGHSEGGLIGPMLASERKDVDFIIMMAGPGGKVAELMVAQNDAVMESMGADKEDVKKYSPLYSQLLQISIKAKDKEEAIAEMTKAVDKWKAKNTAEVVANTSGIHDEASEKGFVADFANSSTSPWFKYFLGCDASPYLKKLSCKVLAINGSKDVQVVAGPNLAGIKASLAISKSKVYEVKELPGLNHLFQTCTKCSVAEYGDLEETISPLALQTMGDWLDKNVK